MNEYYSTNAIQRKRADLSFQLIDIATMLVMLFVLNPLTNFSGRFYLIIASFIIWTICAAFSFRNWFTQVLFSESVIISILLVTLLFFYTLWGEHGIPGQSLYFIFITLVGACYSNTLYRNKAKYILVAIYAQHLLVLFTTLRFLLEKPDLARLLAQGYSAGTLAYKTWFTGGYSFVYSCVFIAIYFFYKCLFDKCKTVYAALLFLELLLLVKAQYTISVLMFFIGAALLVIYKIIRLKAKILTILFLPLVMILIPTLLFTNIIPALIEANFGALSIHLKQVMGIINGDLQLGDSAFYRLKLYIASIKSFLNFPLFGVGNLHFDQTEYEIIGRHSTLLDNLAIWGLVPNLLAYAVTYLYYKRFKMIQDYPYKVLSIIFIIFFLLSTVNTTFQPEILFTVFVIIPWALLPQQKNASEKPIN